MESELERVVERGSFVRGLLEGLELGCHEQSRIAVIHASLDDTGDCNQHGMTAIVGYVAHIDQWAVFERDWKAALDKAGIKFLHTADFLHQNRPDDPSQREEYDF